MNTVGFKSVSVFLLVVFFLAGCGSSDNSDLMNYMSAVKARPAGPIDPIPTFSPYEPFDYSALMLRGPFDRPSTAKNILELVPQSNIKPDADRPKEALEFFSIESLSMVGTLTRAGKLWALLNDGNGDLHYVREGNYIGKNHGRIIQTDKSFIQVVEIIAAGDGWVERPKTIELRDPKK